MELVAVPFPLADAATSEELRVSHVRAGIERGLELGEDVVLHCADGEFLAARVSGLEFELEDTLYRMEPGVRLPLRDAAARLGVPPDALDVDATVLTEQGVLELLGRLRRRPDRGRDVDS